MPSTFSDLKIQLMATGENNTTWGNVSNVNWEAMEDAVCGQANLLFASADMTLPWLDSNTKQDARCFFLNCVGATGGAARNLIVPNIAKNYMVANQCAETIVVKTATGSGIAIPAGQWTLVYGDGTNIYAMFNYLPSLTLGAPLPITSGGTGTTTIEGIQGSLGLGSMAYQNSNAVGITGGSVTGITDITLADGGTGASDAYSARINLGAAVRGANDDIASLNYGSGLVFGAPVGGWKGFGTINAQGGIYSNNVLLGAGSVTYVDMSGGGTGLTFTSSTGGAITTSGWFTLGGVLGVGSGGTGTTSIDGIRGNLGLGSMAYQNSNNVDITGGWIRQFNANTTGGIVAGTYSTQAGGHYYVGVAGQPQSYVILNPSSGSTPTYLGNGSQDFQVHVNNALRMYIRSDGAVGIGTDAPGHMLHVNGNIGCGTFYGDSGGLTGTANIHITGNSAYANSAGTASNSNALGGQGPGYWMNRATDTWQTSLEGTPRFLWTANSHSYYRSGDGHVWRNGGDAQTMVLDGGGNLTATGNVAAFSDAKLKTNLQPIHNALDKVCELSGYTYDRIDMPTAGRQVGLIAQEVKEVLPEAVILQGDTLTLAYGNMVALLVEAIKELREEVASLKGYDK